MRCVKLILICLLFFGAISCSDSRIFDEVQSLPDSEWKAETPLVFSVNIADTILAYDILVHIRNNNSYEYSNIWVFIETSSPNGAVMRDTVEFVLANDKGEWFGKGLSTVNTMLIPYKYNIRFPYRGIYSFSFQQAMRQNVVNGMKDIGLRIQEHQ